MRMKKKKRIVFFMLALILTLGLLPMTSPVSAKSKPLRVLVIGNSYSDDGLMYFYDVAKSAGYTDIKVGVLFIGSCDLTMHWDNANGDKAAYTYKTNFDGTWKSKSNTTIKSALTSEDWDFIGFQQVSLNAGKPETFEPYLGNLIDYVNTHKTNSDAKLVWHMTWAYAKNSNLNGFANYNNDQITMYNAIANAAETAIMEKYDGVISVLVPTGTAIQNMRTTKIGDSDMTRDTTHLSDPLGRYAAALTWFKALTGESISDVNTNMISSNHLEAAKAAANAAIETPYAVTSIDDFGEEPIKYSMTTDKTVYTVGEDIVITYSGSTGIKDWVGVCYEEAPQYKDNHINVWVYLNSNTDKPGTAIKHSGTVTLAADKYNLKPRDYKMFFMLNDGYDSVAEVHFTVVEPVKNPDKPAKISYKRDDVAIGYASGKVSITPPQNDTGISGFALYWADENGKLSSYSPIGYVKYKSGQTTEYQIPAGIIYPQGAKSIIAYSISGENSSNEFASTDIDVSKIITLPKELYSFQVLSDIHIIADANHAMNKNFDLALKDILKNNPDSKAIFTVGDNINSGLETEWIQFKKIVDNNKNGLPKIYPALGNHDLLGESSYDELIDLFKQYTGAPAPYYSVDISNNTFIVLGSQTRSAETGDFANLLEDQMAWLETTLEKASKDGNAIFVFLHQPLKNTTSGTLVDVNPSIQEWHGVIQDAELRKLLDKYPNLIMFTGHTHWKFDSLQPILLGYGKTANYLNSSSVGYLWTDEGTREEGSQGYTVDVYQNFVIVRGRDFAKEQWSSNAQFLIPIDNGSTNEDSSESKTESTTSDSDIPTGDNIIKWVTLGLAGLIVPAFITIMILRKKKLSQQ